MKKHSGIAFIFGVIVCAAVFLSSCGGGGGSSSGGTTEATPPPTVSVPLTPQALTGTSGNSRATLSWQPVSGATSYNLYWSTSTGVTPGTGTRISNAARPYTHTGRTNGTTYYYVVTAANSAGESPASSEVNVRPWITPPTSVTATPANSEITLAWMPVSGATSYSIYRGTASGVTRGSYLVASPGATSLQYSDSDSLSNGTTYYYVVTAHDTHGESIESAEVHAIPAINSLAVPTGVTAARGDGHITLNWNAMPGATSYTIYRGFASDVHRTPFGGTVVAAPPYDDTGLVNGTTYYYVVTASYPDGIGGSMESLESSVVNATPTAPRIKAFVFSYDGSAPSSAPLTSVSIDNCINNTPITDATVVVNGQSLAYNSSSGEYEGNVVIAPGAAVSLTAYVNSSTHAASYTQYINPTMSSPVVSTPTTIWNHAQDNSIDWTGGSPTAGSSYFVGIFDATGSLVYPVPSTNLQELAISTTSQTVAANTLATGSRTVMVGIGTAGLTTGGTGLPISNTCSGSGLFLGTFETVPIRVE